jgi:prepilin-type N-terminal cleavage/methylation domain-containing protein
VQASGLGFGLLYADKAMHVKRSFTLIEIIIVLVILSLMAGVGVPVFSKAIKRSQITDATTNMSMIHAANVLYKVRNGSNVIAADLAALNTTLGLNIIANGASYRCASGYCYAAIDNTEAEVQLSLATALSATNPVCVGDECPGS